MGPFPGRCCTRVSRFALIAVLVVACAATGLGYVLSSAAPATHTASANFTRAQGGEEAKQNVNSLGMKFAPIPPYKFQMGSPAKEEHRGADETQHEVTIT